MHLGIWDETSKMLKKKKNNPKQFHRKAAAMHVYMLEK